MTALTGGRVVYGRTVQPAQFESKKAEVELTFGIEEGTTAAAADKFIAAVGQKAIAHAHALVGITTPAAGKPEKEAKAPKEPKTEEKIITSQGTGAKLDIDLDGGAKPNISTGEERKDPAQEVDDFLGDTKPAEITDKKLIEVVSTSMATVNKPQEIAKVRAKYAPQPKRIGDIPQDKRAAFIAEIEAIK